MTCSNVSGHPAVTSGVRQIVFFYTQCFISFQTDMACNNIVFYHRKLKGKGERLHQALTRSHTEVTTGSSITRESGTRNKILKTNLIKVIE